MSSSLSDESPGTVVTLSPPLVHYTLASKVPGLDSLVKLGFPPSRSFDALNAASDDVDLDDEPADSELTANRSSSNSSTDPAASITKEGMAVSSNVGSGPSSSASSASSASSSSSSSPSSSRSHRRSSTGINRRYLWRTEQDPRSKNAAMALAQGGDCARVPPFSKENSQIHTSSPLPLESNLTSFVAVRCLSDRIHAVSSDGIVHSYRVTRNTAVRATTNSKDEMDAGAAYAAEKQSRIAARAARDFIPLSVQVVSPSTWNPEDERLSIPVCWNVNPTKVRFFNLYNYYDYYDYQCGCCSTPAMRFRWCDCL